NGRGVDGKRAGVGGVVVDAAAIAGRETIESPPVPADRAAGDGDRAVIVVEPAAQDSAIAADRAAGDGEGGEGAVVDAAAKVGAIAADRGVGDGEGGGGAVVDAAGHVGLVSDDRAAADRKDATVENAAPHVEAGCLAIGDCDPRHTDGRCHGENA